MFNRKPARIPNRQVKVKHVHQPDARRSFYAYCVECKALITCATAKGMTASTSWRRTTSQRAIILAGPRWDR
jgi:hypothetical protein